MGLTALERFMRQIHKAEQVARHEMNPGDPVNVLLDLLEIIVVTPCAAHDVHNAFRWSMQAEFRDKELLRDCYIAIESLRNPLTSSGTI